MAIDRTKGYYKEWTNDRGWNLTLEIIPSGKFDDYTYNIEAVTFEKIPRGMMSIKTHKMSFDKIPFGVRDAASMEIEFDFTDLQDNLKEILKNPFYDHTDDGYPGLITTNIFVLKSDRGTNGASSFVEFTGGQRATLSNSYTMERNPVTDDFITRKCTIEAIDVLKLILEQTSTQEWADMIFSYSTYVDLKAIVATNLRDWELDTDVSLVPLQYGIAEKQDWENSDHPYDTAAHLYRMAHLFNQGLAVSIERKMSAWFRHRAFYGDAPLYFNMTINRSPLVALTFKQQETDRRHRYGSDIPGNDIRIIGKTTAVIDPTDIHAGMLVSDKDGESYLEYTYLWDLLKNLCEGFCCKLTYKPIMRDDASGDPRLTYEISYDKIFANPSGSAIDLSSRFADAQEEEFEFTPCSGIISIGTTELSNMQDPDISHFDAEIPGNQSDVRINAKLIHHNLPTANIVDSPRIGYRYQLREPRIHLRKLYHGFGLKVHEYVKIDDGINSTEYPDIIDFPIIELPSLAETNQFASEERLRLVKGWAISTQQQSGLPYAVSNFYLSRFSHPAQNEIPVTMFMVNGETMPENCGDTAIIPVIDGFEGSEKATMLEMEADWQRGTIDITFMTRGD